MTMWTRAVTGMAVGAMLAAGGCGGDDQTRAERSTARPTPGSTADIGMKAVNAALPGIDTSYSANYAIDDPRYPGKGGPPPFGAPSGTGFSVGDALNESGSGSGMMGYNGNGKMGTSWAITDMHPQGKPNPAAPVPVLPAQ